MINDTLLQQLKSTMLEILMQIDLICQRHGLHYVLVGGSLLGAARHKGFIPWDDDLDIAMPREDYIQFTQFAKEELPKEYHFRCSETDASYILPFGKVCKAGTEYVTEIDQNSGYMNEIFVDIFPLDNAKYPSSTLQTLQACAAKGLTSVLIRRANLNITKTSVAVKCLVTICRIFPSRVLQTMQQKIMQWNQDTSSAYYVNIGSNYNFRKQTMKKSVYFPEEKIAFEGQMFPAPRDADFYLKRIYGENYMDLPPVEKRVSHNIVRLKVG